ncbi:MAG TPA: 5-(carboxyamino)imidazole ribonucleotide synthase, partial [Phototrophicaceae bacterium]|nr:5-(carboxyamino)imidazole ribonucleotide synthase [Phototrophicaceae bacterium]
LFALEKAGVVIYPKPSTLAIIQDKLKQKEVYAAAGLAVPAYCAVETPDEVLKAAELYGYPLVLKARYGGYDGYGNATIRTPDDLPAAWEKLAKRETRGLMVEAFVPFARELAVMVLRKAAADADGETRAYPVVETVQQNHICHIVRCPAPVSDAVQARATELATKAVELLDGVGVFGVELFHLADDTVLLNEIAPRPHNSGHYTMEACVTSQFENHLRAVLGLPLGSTALRAPAAVMVNLLGNRAGETDFAGIRAALAAEGVSVHLYGKREVRPGRKMGHITALGDDVEATEKFVLQAAESIAL